MSMGEAAKHVIFACFQLYGCFAMSMGEAAKRLLFEGFQAGCHVVLRGRRGTL